jgi:hypothetical protein
MVKRKILFFYLILVLGSIFLAAQEPKLHWNFEKIEKQKTKEILKGNYNPEMSPPVAYVITGKTLEVINGKWDSLEGNFAIAAGISGQGLRLDGYTTCLRATETLPLNINNELTVEVWVALGEYPLNWCPILTTETTQIDGYRLLIGPYGQVSMEVAIDGQWRSATTERETIPLRKWMHIVGTYKANSELKVYVNGELRASSPIIGQMKPAKGNFLVGMVASPAKPSDIVSEYGTLPDYFGLEGILDEVKVYDAALSGDQVKAKYQQVKVTSPDLQPKRLPRLEHNPEKFGAFYTTLKYYPAWDNLWPVSEHADVVVTFDKSPVKLIFWRGTRYSPAWVSENELWMADQSVEAWNDEEGCFEHMQDRHCRLSSVRIIENNEARVVVHWRYAPVSAYEDTWRRDPKTGWECWVDEYYYIYPDRTAIRKVSWKKGTLGLPRQFQESEVLLQPEQKVCEVVEKDFATVADYKGNKKKVSFVEDPNKPPYGPFNWDKFFDYTIQQFNFKAKNKPFICFEPGNKMWLRYENLNGYCLHTRYDHWPVGQARCDGRRSIMADRPSHTLCFPRSDPFIHETDTREYWSGLYGMNDLTFDEIIKFGRSWAYPAELVIQGDSFKSEGYDKSERCYKIYKLSEKPKDLIISLKGSKNSPLFNPAIYVKNWNSSGAKVLVNNKEIEGSKVGINKTLEGIDLVLFVPLNSESEVQIKIEPVK